MISMRLTPVLAAVIAALAGACASQNQPVLAKAESSLALMDDCDSLRAGFVEDAVAKIERTATEVLREEGYGGGVFAGRAEGDSRAAAPSASGAGANQSAAPRAHSETNTQVEGVDEADIVKTDGRRLFTLTDGVLRVLKSWPANETVQLGQLRIEGYANEMFLSGDRVVVFSQTQDPRRDAARCGGPDSGYGYYCWYQSFTKVTIVGVAEGNLTVERELFLEGNYTTSRRYDSVVRTVLQHWGWTHEWQLPQVWEYLNREGDPSEYENVAPYGYAYRRLTATARAARVALWRADALAAVRARRIEEWLPARVERVAGSLVTSAPACRNYHLPRPGLVDYGLTQVVSLDLETATAPITSLAIAGYTGTVYSNRDALVLAQPDWSAWYRAYQSGADTISDQTAVHRFDLAANGDATYKGSTFVPGSINDQFSIDERSGFVRIASTETTWPVWRAGVTTTRTTTTKNFVTTYTGEVGTNRLARAGTLELITDNERVQSARFLGDRAYVVTFRQTDPLFAVDLTNDRAPRLLGELKIPGFSTYMHPLDANHLLAIGYDADESGRQLGLALQIFNIADATHPALVHKHVFMAEGWGYSEANWDHKAFTYFAAEKLLAFPFASWNAADGSYRYRSSLEVFRVGTDTGFASLASLRHDDLIGPYCLSDGRWGCSGEQVSVRRGVFADEYVYSVSNGGVLVHDTTRPETAVARVAFNGARPTSSGSPGTDTSAPSR